jgi:hypothetical protein
MTRNRKGYRTPGQARALEYISSAGFQKESIQTMAAKAGVSYVTMWKAVRRGGGTRLYRPGTQAPAWPAWARTKAALYQDLISGRLEGRAGIPGISLLCRRYGTGYRTTRRALRALCEEGVLVAAGRRHVFGGSALRTRRMRVGVLIFSWYEGPLEIVAEYEQEFLLRLDAECARRQIGVSVFRFHLDRQYRAVLTDISQSRALGAGALEELDGLILPVSSEGCHAPDVLARLADARKPLAIVDQIADWDLPEFLAKPGRCLRIDARPFDRCARAVSGTLIGMGHRRIAYISPYHGDPWSRRLLTGIEQSTAGSTARVFPFLIRGTMATDEYTRAGRERYSEQRLIDAYLEWKKQAPRAYTVQLQRYFGRDLEQQVWNAEVRHRLTSLLQKAAEDQTITCWIVPHENTACFANDFIREHGLSVSLVALGSTLELAQQRIASYDYNAQAGVTAALEFILAPHRKLPGQQGGRYSVEGMMTLRESLRRRGA